MKYSFPIALFVGILSTPLLAQDQSKKDPSATSEKTVQKQEVFKKGNQPKISNQQAPTEIGILIEYISLDHKTANELLQQFSSHPNDVQELRDILDQMIDNNEATLIETCWLRSKSGHRSKTESIREDIYPTGFDPPEIPTYVGNSDSTADEANPAHLTSANPTTFDCRNVGSTLEVDPVLSADLKSIAINLAPEIVVRLDDRYFTQPGFEESARGIEHIAMPTFYTIKDTTQIEVAPGKYNLLGLHTPPNDSDQRVFTLLRSDLIPIN
tara:strand:+ start:165 stop:971 length:807 start_codon:yes stop_codon:yes gene_type:complete